MNKAKELIMLFLEETPMEDLTHLKYIMPEKEIEKFIDEWIHENAFNLIADSGEKKKTSMQIGHSIEKTIPLKKTYHLKVTVEREELRADD